MSPSAADRLVKQERLAALRAAHGGSPLILTSHEAIAWYLDGIRTHVEECGAGPRSDLRAVEVRVRP